MKNEYNIQNGSSHFISDIEKLEIDEMCANILPQWQLGRMPTLKFNVQRVLVVALPLISAVIYLDL
jgi:hypothetical protein